MSVLGELVVSETVFGEVTDSQLFVLELKLKEEELAVIDYRTLQQRVMGSANFLKVPFGHYDLLLPVDEVAKGKPVIDRHRYSLRPSDTVDYARLYALYKDLADAGVEHVICLGSQENVISMPTSLLVDRPRHKSDVYRSKMPIKYAGGKSIIWR